MKKAFDQTFRDIKRGVNKKVLKVPTVEQKVLDATSNEPWGPHGSLLAEIAQATRNYHEYQIIMSVIWKRTNDTGKNWRHVYKALIVLEFLVANGSDRVIDDIREHAYQISTLSDFQYIDSNGKDQGSNVRKKSQSLVVLVTDKERIQEVREKAASNRDRYNGAAADRRNRPGSEEYGGYGDRYGDDRYGNREDDRNGHGRYGDSYGREEERYGRDSEGQYGRDRYRDEDYSGRSRSSDDNGYSSRSRSADRYRNNANEEAGQYSSRGNGARVDDHRQDGSTMGERVDRKYSDNTPGPPPGYDEAVGTGHTPSYNDGDREFSQPNAPQESIISDASQSHKITIAAPTPATASPPAPGPVIAPAPTLVSTATSVLAPTSAVQHSYQEVDGFDEFDPRGPSSAVPVRSDSAPAPSTFEMDLFGSLSESFSSNSLSMVPASQPTMTSEANGSASFDSGPTFEAAPTASLGINQPFDDPFGDGPFRALPSTDNASVQPQITTPTNTFNTNFSPNDFDVHQQAPPNATAEFGATFNDASYMSSGPSGPQEIDILADILPLTEPSSSVNTQTGGYPVSAGQSGLPNGFSQQTNQPVSPAEYSSFTSHSALQSSFQAQTGQPSGFPPQPQQSQPSPQTGFPQQGQPLPQTGLPQHGQPSPQTGFPQQGQPLPQTDLPQLGQPLPQSGFPQQGWPSETGFPQQGQPSQASFPQQGQPSLQTGFPQQGQPSTQTGFPRQQPSPQTGFPLQGQPSQTGFHQQGQPSQTGFPQQGQPSPQTGFPQQGQPSQTGFPQQGQPSPQTGFPQQGQPSPQTGFPQQGQSSQTSFPQQGQPSETGFRQQGQSSQTGFPQQGQPSLQTAIPQQGQPSLQIGFLPQQGQPSPQASFPHQGQPSSQTGYLPSTAETGFLTQTMVSTSAFQAGQPPQLGFHSQSGPMQPNIQNPSLYGAYNLQSLSARPASGNMVSPISTEPVTQHNFLPQSSLAASVTSLVPQSSPLQSSNHVAPQSTNPPTMGPVVTPQSSNDKFETKSTVWADTLSRGLVNLNISGPKANPTADIGIDFEAMNRKEKRKEKQTPATSTVTSTVTMGKAMGSGSGMGRAGASALRAPPNPMMNPGMNMGMAGGPGTGFGMGGYNQPAGRGMGMGVPGTMGMGMNMPSNMGMAMNMPRPMGMEMNMPGNMGMGQGMNGNMGMGQGMNLQQPMRYPPGATQPGGYNHIGGPSYGQHPQGGGYR